MAAPTGVVHQNQCGGHACARYEQEGYLVPLSGTDLDEDMNEIFVGELKGWDKCGLEWPAGVLDRLRAAVDSLGMYGSGRSGDLYPPPLVLDEPWLSEAAEAWIPVITADGPGVLVWENSDQPPAGPLRATDFPRKIRGAAELHRAETRSTSLAPRGDYDTSHPGPPVPQMASSRGGAPVRQHPNRGTRVRRLGSRVNLTRP
ncbi:DUF6210 family protein [Kitasatospora sp. NPDC053057]|uniref:DUF6210 family protein n=1 Tax=Kitasatospora sp. NPDC053057 TaxID=3364062 RepID=UPI0037C6596B